MKTALEKLMDKTAEEMDPIERCISLVAIRGLSGASAGATSLAALHARIRVLEMELQQISALSRRIAKGGVK